MQLSNVLHAAPPKYTKKYTRKLLLYLKACVWKKQHHHHNTTHQDFTQAQVFDTSFSNQKKSILKAAVRILATTYGAFLPQEQMPRAAKQLVKALAARGQPHKDSGVHTWLESIQPPTLVVQYSSQDGHIGWAKCLNQGLKSDTACRYLCYVFFFKCPCLKISLANKYIGELN